MPRLVDNQPHGIAYTHEDLVHVTGCLCTRCALANLSLKQRPLSVLDATLDQLHAELRRRGALHGD